MTSDDLEIRTAVAPTDPQNFSYLISTPPLRIYDSPA